MKYFILFVVVIGIIWFIRKPSGPEKSIPTGQTVTPPPNLQNNTISLSSNGSDYLLSYEPIYNKNIVLIPNFTEKKTSSQIVEEEKCKIASSGGFYTKNDTPLGLFKVNGKIINKRINNSNLLTGFLSIADNGDIAIDEGPNSNSPTILQSGPLFKKGVSFSSANTEFARRIVVFEDEYKHPYLGVLYQEENTFVGPRLDEIPHLLFSINKPFVVQKALNLDGGSASFFMDSSRLTLSELVSVGSIICIK